MQPRREDTEPWYRQFWPWFLISLPASVVIAAMFTINLAIESADGVVSDSYYKDGLAIHMDASSSEMARNLGIRAVMDYDAETGAVAVRVAKAPANESPLLLEFIHPTRPHQDQATRLVAGAGNEYHGRVEPLGPAKWHIRLQPEDHSWRIEARMHQPGGISAILE